MCIARTTTTLYDEGSSFYDQFKEHIEARERVRKQKVRDMFRPIYELYTECEEQKDDLLVTSGSNLHAGDQLLERIYAVLDSTYRSPSQKGFHKMMLGSCLRLIYGSEFTSQRHRVCRKYGFASRNQAMLICAPRRFGKTFATSIFAIAMCVCMSDIEVSIFSPGKRQSIALMGHIFTLMEKMGLSDRVVSRNAERMLVQSHNGRFSKINGYPSKVATLKGTSGDIIILEEAAQLDPELLFEVVAPLYQIDRATMIGITTIRERTNFLTKMMHMKNEHGEMVFYVKHVYNSCEACRQAGKGNTCNHNAHMLPTWSSKRKNKQVKAMMQMKQDLLAREIGGEANELHDAAFHKDLVRKFESSEPYSLRYDQTYPYVFICIDPNGCGESSDFAITTMILHQGQRIILGLESLPSRTARENHQLILDHVDMLERDPRLGDSLKVFIIESNLGNESEHIAAFLEVEQVRNYVVPSQRNDEKHVGFMTTNAIKSSAVESLRNELMDDAMRICEESAFVCVSHSYSEIRGILFEQLEDYSMVVKDHEIQKPRKYYSGKSAGKDDLITTVLLCNLWAQVFLRDDKYSHLRNAF